MYQCHYLSEATKRLTAETIASASEAEITAAQLDCYIWRDHWPESDQYDIVARVELLCRQEIMTRAVSKIAGGERRPVHLMD